eukprot:gnl/MRDRNA2_/MRDRNA2_71197_c0_seq1.p1 gnl/MRDRNA2_/MRDRNA2_71197_c0~~gnl/MRDRNA2_/MRDRNA2_71197_c0_seq1.p1  ORF type:complete len:328 (-),score=47.85 gnl/MRDRNA2_/MRDRNA2_71197_c0_seq1:255-1238(-)
MPGTPPEVTICNVWASNFDDEFERMLDIVGRRCRYIAFDTEYPGMLQPLGAWTDCQAAIAYSNLRTNVDLTKLIQIGLAFADEHHALLGCWQFHFHFDCSTDRCDPKSVGFLADAGVDFRRHAIDGLSMESFGEKLMASGLVLSDEVQWVAFHGMYDFAYMLKLLTGAAMPVSITRFNEALDTFFCSRLDLKWHFPRGSLSKLGEKHGLYRHGTAHQGGSDALLTLELFFCLARTQRLGNKGHLFGLHESSHHSNEDGTTQLPCHKQILAAQRSAARERGNNALCDGHENAQWIAWGQSSCFEDQYTWSQMSSLSAGAFEFVPRSWR